jgi:hypothetical protein
LKKEVNVSNKSRAGNKQVILATSFAYYYNITTEFSPQYLGVDFITIFSSALLIGTYNIGAYAVDRFGLTSIIAGNFGLMIANWIWYLAFQNFAVVVLSIVVSSITGPMVTVSILAVSNRWFPEHERAKATAAGSLCGLLGAGAAVVIGPMFETGPNIVDLSLRSCQASLVSDATVEALANATSYGVSLACTTDAYTAFCCYIPADIQQYNLVLAVIQTIVFLISLVSVRNLPYGFLF